MNVGSKSHQHEMKHQLKENHFCSYHAIVSINTHLLITSTFYREPRWSSPESRSPRSVRISLPTSSLLVRLKHFLVRLDEAFSVKIMTQFVTMLE